jgi:hypothetical protein
MKKMDDKTIKIIIFISILSLFQVTICSAKTDQMTTSIEKIVLFWKKSLSNGLNIVIYDSDMNYWYVNRIGMVSQSFDFEIIHKDANNPHSKLIVCFSFNRWDNRFSPNANSNHESENRTWGFKSLEDAKSNTLKSDFNEAEYNYIEKISRVMRIVYLLKNDNWVLEGGNDLYQEYIGQYIPDEQNAHLFATALFVPIK